MFKKALASIGIGSASVDTYLATSKVVPGGTLQGEVQIRGGNVEQEIRGIELRVETFYMEEVNDSTVRQEYVLGSFRMPESVVVQPGERIAQPFSIEIPYAAPLSLGAQRTWLRTSLDLEMAVDPKDMDQIQIQPTPLQGRLLEALTTLGFHLSSARCEKNRRLARGVPFVQEFEMKPRSGAFRNRLDEIDVIGRVDSEGLEVLLEIDRKARGLVSFFEEALDMDETLLRLRFSEADLSAPVTQWAARLQQVIEAHA